MTADAARLLRHVAWMSERQNSESPIAMTIESRVPSKWRFVDLETGDVWRRLMRIAFRQAYGPDVIAPPNSYLGHYANALRKREQVAS